MDGFILDKAGRVPSTIMVEVTEDIKPVTDANNSVTEVTGVTDANIVVTEANVDTAVDAVSEDGVDVTGGGSVTEASGLVEVSLINLDTVQLGTKLTTAADTAATSSVEADAAAVTATAPAAAVNTTATAPTEPSAEHLEDNTSDVLVLVEDSSENEEQEDGGPEQNRGSGRPSLFKPNRNRISLFNRPTPDTTDVSSDVTSDRSAVTAPPRRFSLSPRLNLTRPIPPTGDLSNSGMPFNFDILFRNV